MRTINVLKLRAPSEKMVSVTVISDHLGTSTPAAICLIICAFALVALCAKHSRSSRVPNQSQNMVSNQRVAPKPSSPLESPEKLGKNFTKRAIPNICMKLIQHRSNTNGEESLWKKTILMGEKCQPLQFPGAIYYDSEGNQLSEPPRSPRTSPSLPLHVSDSVP